MRGNFLIVFCVVGAVCGSQVFVGDEMAPGIRTRVSPSTIYDRRAPVRVPVGSFNYPLPITFTPNRMTERETWNGRQRDDGLISTVDPQNHGIPSQNHRFPSQNYGIPSQNHGFPSQNHGFPSQNHGFPSQNHEIPSQNYGIPSQNHRIPSQHHGIPDSSGLSSETRNVVIDDRTQPTSHLTPRGGASPSPLEGNFDEMNMDTMMTMSQISTVEEFARLMGVDLPRENIEPGSINSRNYNIAARFGATDEGVSVPPNAGCKPEVHTVRLKLEPQLNVVHFPTCVRLPRCGGCCAGHLLACRPVEVKPVKLKILRVEQKEEQSGRSAAVDFSEGRSRRRRPRPEGNRRRRDTSSSYVMVEEEEHTACSCQCRVQEQDCNPHTHSYVPNDCQCVCRNKDEREKCETQSLTHHWDTDDCACYCRHTEHCSTGSFFDHKTCSCSMIPVRGRSGGSVAPDADVSRRPPERAPVVFEPSTWGASAVRPQPHGRIDYPMNHGFQPVR